MFQPDLLAGHRVLITGGGTGLGKSMGGRFLELGAELAICGRREEVLEEAAREHAEATGGQGPGQQCGRQLPCPARSCRRARSNAVVGIVLKGSINCTLACGRRWRATRHPGTVLSITTTYAWSGSAYVLPSAIAKAGVLAVTQSLAVEWAAAACA